MNWTAEDAQAYIEEAKSAGFTLNEKNGDQFDVDWYAENADSNSNSIQIHLPTE
jgi:hypothetical protein